MKPVDPPAPEPLSDPGSGAGPGFLFALRCDFVAAAFPLALRYVNAVETGLRIGRLDREPVAQALADLAEVVRDWSLFIPPERMPPLFAGPPAAAAAVRDAVTAVAKARRVRADGDGTACLRAVAARLGLTDPG